MVVGKDYDKTYLEANKICEYIKSKSMVKVLGPAEDFIVKIDDKYRFIINLKFNDEKIISAILEQIYIKYENSKEYRIMINRM